MEEQAYTVTMLVANKPSVTSRVTGLFSGRGYNLESICGAPTHTPGISRITLKTRATPDKFIEIQKQLNRLIDVVKLRDMTVEEKAVQREMALISIERKAEQEEQLKRLVDEVGAKIVNESVDSFIVEVTGTEKEVDGIIARLTPYSIRKSTRSGILALYRELDPEVNDTPLV